MLELDVKKVALGVLNTLLYIPIVSRFTPLVCRIKFEESIEGCVSSTLCSRVNLV